MAQCLEKLFFNKVLSGLILSGQGNKQDCFPDKVFRFFLPNMFSDDGKKSQ